MFMDDRTVAQIAPSGDFGNTLDINCDNPLMSAQQRALICQAAVYNPADANPARAGNLSNFGNLVGQTPIFGPDPDGTAGPLRAPLLGFTAPQTFVDPSTGLPYLRANLQALRRNVEGGGRRDDLQHTSYRIVAGMNGQLNDAWSYDMYYQFGQTNFAETYSNDFSVRRLGLALDVVDDPAVVGVNPICRSAQAGGSDAACVPWDIFALNSVSPASLLYLQTPGLQRGVTQQSIANASITGDLGSWGMKFPWANNGVGIAFGVEYRRETLELLVDQAFSTLPSSDLAGQGAPTLPVAGDFDVKEAFVEVRIPIVEDSFFSNLSLEGGYRYSDYGIGNRSISTDTYKVAVDFAPIRDIRFRATYNRAVRAPNIQELFAPQRVVLDGSTDPCANLSGQAPSAPLAACQAMGVSAAQYGFVQANQASQYNGLIGGNPNLDPEVADTWTVGIVLQPSFIPHLAITVDWFDITLNQAIQGVGADTILSTCVATRDPTFCGLVHRDQFGSLWRTGNGYVSDLSINIGSFKTRGVDVQASYSMELGGLGGLSASFVGTWLDTLITDNGVSVPYDCVGFFGTQCGTPNPEWRHTLHLSWTHPSGIGFAGRWRYFSGVDLDLLSPNETLNFAGGGTPTTAQNNALRPADFRIPSQSYFDLTFTARIGDHYNFRLGVNNILDKDPPLVGSNACPAGICNGNAYTQVYDALGRYIFAGVTLDF
jgi:outer membrane receptor protein involved in Fe transport